MKTSRRVYTEFETCNEPVQDFTPHFYDKVFLVSILRYLYISSVHNTSEHSIFFLKVSLSFDSAFMYRAGFRLLFLLCREIFHDHALTVFLHSNGIEIIIRIMSVCSFTNVQTGKKTKNIA